MIGGIEPELQACKQAGTAVIQQISISSLQQMISFHHPPQAALVVLQTVQIVLAGTFGEVEMNPATIEPRNNDWYACRKMACRSSSAFLKTCQLMFDKFESDPYLDTRVQSASQQLEAAELTFEKVNNVSQACAKLLIWLQNIIKYWQLLKNKQA